MAGPLTVLDHLRQALERTQAYDRNDRVGPAAVLWLDKAGDWAPAVARLRDELPLFVLGAYDPKSARGPAYWLRCIIDRTLPESPPREQVPILYLPGFERADLRAVESAPPELRPLAELQYRGVVFGTRASRDWSVTGFFHNHEQGLGVEIASDEATRDALRRALPLLLEQPVDALRARGSLRSADLDRLVTPDPIAAVLRWLSHPTGFRQAADDTAWGAFGQTCRETYAFDPETDGPITAAKYLGTRNGAWGAVWRRYADAPRAYPGVADQLRAARPEELVPDHPDSWPQINEEREADLRGALRSLRDVDVESRRERIIELERLHHERRRWVWAVLGEAPLARALEHAATIARDGAQPAAGTTPLELARAYADGGWRLDAALLYALESVTAARDRDAVESACVDLYRTWADGEARAFQSATVDGGTDEFGQALPGTSPGECRLFTDGLRLDLAHRLAAILRARGLQVEIGWTLSALPSVTATAKPAVSPVVGRIRGDQGFETRFEDTGQSVTAQNLRRAIADAGVQVLIGDELGEPTGRGWAEYGSIDEVGHSQVNRFAYALEPQLLDLSDRVEALARHGWKTVSIVTDHGWLYIPDGLEKVDLSQHLTETRKGRAARLAHGATGIEHPTVAWRWDDTVEVAVAPGLACYTSGREYEHGGLSPQECVTPLLKVTEARTRAEVSITELAWVGMRLRARVTDAPSGAILDLRTRPASPATSIAGGGSEISAEGAVSILVPDPEDEGRAVSAVVLSATGTLVAQAATIVGGR